MWHKDKNPSLKFSWMSLTQNQNILVRNAPGKFSTIANFCPILNWKWMIVNQGIYGEKARKKLSQCIFTEAAQRSRWITHKKEIVVAQRKHPSEKSPRLFGRGDEKRWWTLQLRTVTQNITKVSWRFQGLQARRVVGFEGFERTP